MDIFDVIEKNDAPSVQTIIDQTPSIIHHRNNNHETLLHWACERGHTDVAKLLIDAGADVHAKNKIGWTPLHAVCYHGHTDVAKLLIDAGTDVNAQTNYKSTPLHLACWNNCTTIVSLLIRAGANWLDANNDNRTPVDEAIEEQSNVMLIFLATIVDQLPDSERKKIQAWRFRQEITKTR